MGRDKQGWLLALLAAGAGVVGLVVVGYFLSTHGSGPERAATIVPLTPAQLFVDLWDAYRQAHAAVRAEAADAQLVSASTQWRAVSEQALLAGTGDWSFVFYSAEKGRLLNVVVSGGAAQTVNQTRVWHAASPLTGAAWKAGPKDALLVFLAYGGRQFLDEHPQAVVDLHLAEHEGANGVWSIVALDREDRGVISVLIDAETMEVLSIAP